MSQMANDLKKKGKTPRGWYTSFVLAPYPPSVPPPWSTLSPSSSAFYPTSSSHRLPEIVEHALASILPMPSPSPLLAVPELPSSSASSDDGAGSSVSGVETLSSQVGGHAGILSLDEALIIKPVDASKGEKVFYEAMAQSYQGHGMGLEESSEDEDEDDTVERAVSPSSLRDSPTMSDLAPNIPASPFERLRRWIPKFYGTLKLEGRVAPSPQGNQLMPATEGAEGPTDELLSRLPISRFEFSFS